MRTKRAAIFSIAAGLIIAGAVAPLVVYAVAHCVNYTTQQDTLIQQKGIAAYNRAKCGRYGRPPGCTSAQLTASGCVPVSMCQAANIPPTSTACTTFSTVNYESCLIYTNDTTGEDAMFQEMTNRGLVEAFLQSKTQDNQDYRDAWNNGTQTQQQNACTALGLPSNCQGPGL